MNLNHFSVRNQVSSQPKTIRPLPWTLRSVAWVLITLQMILPIVPQLLVSAATVAPSAAPPQSNYETPPPAPQVAVNRTVPPVSPPSNVLEFSASPTDEEISQARVFPSPIISIGNDSSPTENADLAAALLAYRNRVDPDDASAIENFLQQYPQSPRYISLSSDLAAHYRRTGHFSKALTTWEQIWNIGKDITDLNGRKIVDQSVGDWAAFLVTLGRKDDIKELLQEVQGRDLHGAAAARVTYARDALWQMDHHPETTFKCGPYSLSRIQHALNPSLPIRPEIFAEKSTTNGTSLYQNWLLAQKMGLKYQMAKRQPGAEIPLPAMVHWKLGHFGALIKLDNGHYQIQDPTFNQGWISSKILDEEADYFMIPDGPLPAGWTSVDKAEAESVFGRSTPTAGDPSSPNTPPPCPPNNGMAGYSVGLMLISLTMSDTPLSYAPPRGPRIGFHVTYSERAVDESGPFSYSNLGDQWNFNWLEYISDDTTQPNADVELVQDNGNYETFTGFNTNNNTYAVEEKSQGQLTKTSSTSYQCLYPDGSLELYTNAAGTNGPRRVFLTQTIDPQGNAVTLTYDSSNRVTYITDAIGQVTTLSYGLATDGYKITKVTDPFNRFATFQYNGSGQLTNITDVIGVTSAFSYGATNEADFINALTTPYGTTTFTNNNAQYSTFTSTNFSGRWIQVTDPLGAQERYEFTQDAPGVYNVDPSSLIPGGLNPQNLYANAYSFTEQNYRMSFFWDKTTMAAMNGMVDYTKAKQYLWCRSALGFETLSSTLEAVKQPLENGRVWYNYPGQTESDVEGTINQPDVIARVLDDGTTQLSQYQLNSIGKPLLAVDPFNRTNVFTYATNNVDLLSAAQLAAGATNVLNQFTYNSQHLPLTAVDAAGNTTYFGYNTNGQLRAMTNALNQIVLLNYSTNGYLTNIIAGTTTQYLSTNSFTYDGYGRVYTMSDPLGYTITTTYDAADRPTNIAYPDGTYRQIVYDNLDPVLTRDRDGYWTSMAYDPLRRLTDVYDNVGRHTQYGWCGCGSLESITDPMGKITAWVRDLQNRITAKIYPDSTETTYAYATNTSRLVSLTDAKSQTTFYNYFVDDNLSQVTYSNAVVATPSVSFTYDTNYNRITTMTDGTGTTTYNYYNVASGQLGAGMLYSVSNSFIGSSGVITYNYDALGRITNRAINGVSQQIAFDSLNRVTLVTNALGSFTNTYIGGTMLLSTNFYPNGQKTIFSYLSTTHDERLAEIWNQNSGGSTLSKFDYGYDAEGQITNWTQQADASTPTAYTYGYDAGKQLLNAVLNSTGAGATVLKQYAYGYDLSGNRTSEQIGTGTNGPVAISQSGYNNANQITNRISGSGSMEFAGSVSKQAIVTVGGNSASFNHATTNFLGYTSVTNGTNIVPVIATDYDGNLATNKYQLVVTNNGVAETISFDLNGNEISIVTTTSTNIYGWDAANRLVSIAGPTNRSVFVYDGLGRRVQDIEYTNSLAYATNKFIWDGQTLAEQRDVTGVTVMKRFFGEGEQISGTNYYFTRDHLGSVREVVNTTGVMQARYDYDPYGRPTTIAGSFTADFGYAGMYYHAPSSLNLTLYRAYNSDLGRWLNRDPIQELGGINLYEYVRNNPVRYVDPLGLQLLQIDGIIDTAGEMSGETGEPVGVPPPRVPGTSYPQDGPFPPSGTVENPNRPGSFGFNDPNKGSFRECWRFDKGDPSKPGWRGIDHSHYWEDGNHMENPPPFQWFSVPPVMNNVNTPSIYPAPPAPTPPPVQYYHRPSFPMA
jgi:RHS repeat-associated protein